MLSKSDSAIPLLTALLATLVFATVSLAYAFRGRGGIASVNGGWIPGHRGGVIAGQ
jgi:hypothetical protein